MKLSRSFLRYKNLFSSFFRRKKFIFISSFLISVIVVTFFFVAPFVHKGNVLSSPISKHQEKEEFVYNIISPEQKKNENIVLIGKVLSHLTANIYPRRAGIVKDIYVDIGDTVTENQVLGILLPQGVEGQSSASIAEKKAKELRDTSDLKNAQLVSNAAIKNAEQNVHEKRVALDNAEKNKEAILSQVSTNIATTTEYEKSRVEGSKQKIEVARANLQLTEESLEQQKILTKNQISQAENNISQTVSQAEITVANAQSSVEISIFENGSKRSSTRVRAEDLHDSYGSLQNSLRRTFEDHFNTLSSERETFASLDFDTKKENIYSLIDAANTLLITTQELLQNTSSSSVFSQNDLSEKLSSIISAQTVLITQKESLEDAQDAYEITNSSVSDILRKLENQVERDKSILVEAEKNVKIGKSQEKKSVENIQKEYSKQETSQENTIELLKTQLQLAKENLQLVKARERQNIERAKNSLGVSKAMLTSEYTSSGHAEIRSAFSGTISKRSIEVGQMITASKPIFELVDVETSLSKIAKREIQFGLPENFSDLLQVGDTIPFFPPLKQEVTYIATVSRISPQVDESSHNILVQAKIADDVILPHHMSIRIEVPTSKKNVFILPSFLVKRADQQNYIWIVEEESTSAKQLVIDVLSEDGEFAEITGNITEQTQVVTNVPDSFIENK